MLIYIITLVGHRLLWMIDFFSPVPREIVSSMQVNNRNFYKALQNHLAESLKEERCKLVIFVLY